jgi:hypothetical protein
MTEYFIREVGRHQWLVFADRQSIALCASENEAVKVHSANSRRLRDLLESRTKHARRRWPAGRNAT